MAAPNNPLAPGGKSAGAASGAGDAARYQVKGIVPTAEQAAICAAAERTILIEANAGAAKTTTLALRLAQSWASGTPPDLVLALTVTDTARGALKDALRRIGLPAAVVSSLRIQTFEAFCAHMLEDASGAKMPVMSDAESLAPFVWQAVQLVESNAAERWPEALRLPARGDHAMVEEFLGVNSWLKGTLRDQTERQDSPVTPTYADMLEIDYTQLKVFLAYERVRWPEWADRPLFRSEHDAVYDLAQSLDAEEPWSSQRWSGALQLLVVDEMHDMNQASFTILRQLLTTTHCSFIGVGDIDQVIYSRTGAESRFMRGEIAAHTGRSVQRYPLTHSYRFGKDLAAQAGQLAKKPYSSMAGHSTPVERVFCESNEDCVLRLVAKARQWQGCTASNSKSMAVLLRHGHQAVAIENALLQAEIPYAMSGLESYLMRPETLFVRGLLAIAVDDWQSVPNGQTRRKLMQALLFFSSSRVEVPGREHESQEALLESAVQTAAVVPHILTEFFTQHVLRNADPVMKRRLKAALAVAREAPGPAMLRRVMAALEIDHIIQELLVSRRRRADALEHLAGLERAAASFTSASAYFHHLREAEQRQQRLKKTPQKVLIASIEHVKGLEFDQVLLPFLDFGVFPDLSDDPEQERNLFYVGMTRARHRLTLLGTQATPSPFMAL